MKTLIMITEVRRAVTVGALPGRQERRWYAFRPIELTDYFPTPLTWRSFGVGPRDVEGPNDEVYCPCDAALWLGDDNFVLGDFVDMADAHIAEAHPGVRRQ